QQRAEETVPLIVIFIQCRPHERRIATGFARALSKQRGLAESTRRTDERYGMVLHAVSEALEQRRTADDVGAQARHAKLREGGCVPCRGGFDRGGHLTGPMGQWIVVGSCERRPRRPIVLHARRSNRSPAFFFIV